MDDKKIRLPHFVIADLYKSSLVEASAETMMQVALKETFTPAETESKSPGIHYLGENKKLVTVLVNEPESHYLADEHLALLTNIIAACKLRLDDIAIVNVAKEKVTYQLIKTELNALKLLLFEVTPDSIGLPFKMPSFQVQFYDGCHVLLSPELSYYDDSESGKNFKRSLWTCLKSMFNL